MNETDERALRARCRQLWLALQVQSSVETHQVDRLMQFAKGEQARGLREVAITLEKAAQTSIIAEIPMLVWAAVFRDQADALTESCEAGMKGKVMR